MLLQDNLHVRQEKHRLGWKRDIPDVRDHVFNLALGPNAAANLPPKLSLRKHMGDPFDQGNLGSCTANAISKAVEYDERLEHGRSSHLSRLFIYYNERVIEGTVNADDGAEIRDGIKSIAQAGVCTEKIWPYVESRFAEKPPLNAYSNATRYRAVSYARVPQREDTLKATIKLGRPVVFGFTVYDNFWDITSNGIAPMPNGHVAGGHAVVLVGYNDDTKLYECENSWGKDWGDRGYFYLPYAYVHDPNLASDFWVVQTVA